MSFHAELKRRKVFRIGAAYVVIAWLAVQVASIAFPAFDAPAWVLRVFILVLMLGFPIALVMAWVFDITPDGVKTDAAPVGNVRIGLAAVVLSGLALAWYFVGQPSYRYDESADAGISSVAVLPFANLSGKPDEEYFSDGMTEELLNVLARQPKLKVAARTSVFEFKNKGGDIREIGRRLGVSHIVEGSVRRDGQQVRITAQLIRVADGFHVWSETFDRKPESVFALQDEIAQRVTEQLVSSLAGAAPAAARGSIDPQAYDEFLKGRALLRARRSVFQAIGHFRRAVERAPDFAAGWASLSLAIDVSGYVTTAMQQIALGDRLPQMRDAAARAAELAPDAATTLHALANVARGEGRFLEAEQLYERSIASDPSYPDVREDYAEFLTAVGRPDDALAAGRELVALDPLIKVFWYRIAQVGILLDRADLTDEAIARMLELDPQYYFGLTVGFRRAYTHGRFADARREIERAYAINPEATAAEWVLYRWSQKEPVVTDAFAREAILGGYGWDHPQFAAFAGDDEVYFAALESARDADKRFYAYNHLEIPALRHYLADPRAKKLLRDAGFEAYWREKGWPALCRPLGDTDFECGYDGARPRES